jgi:protein-S-isoprenylcysteine O-methyltransferase Ste14
LGNSGFLDDIFAAGGVIGLIAIADILYGRRLEETKRVAEYGETYREYKKRPWF